MDWAQILVIILSVFLAIFLLLAIILIALLIKLTRQIKMVTSSAQRTAEHIETAVAGIARVTSPMLLVKTVVQYMRRLKRKE